MKNKVYILSLALAVLTSLAGCNNDAWLERTPKNSVTDDQVWDNPTMIKSLLSNFYNRLPGPVFNSGASCEADDAMWSGHADQDPGKNNRIEYPFDYARSWEYGLVRDINLALEKLESESNLSETLKKQFSAEFRFIRAFHYFDMIKRMGGVPLVTQLLIYDGSGDPTPLQTPRSKESEAYDFIYNELQEIKNEFSETGNSRTRGNKFAALALQSRSMLYAASIAKYNNLMSSPISTIGGEVGIPADKANDYYQKSLAASREIIESGNFELSTNFYNLFVDKTLKEVIFAKDFMSAAEKQHAFTYDNIARSFSSSASGSSISPSLSFVECFDYLDGSKGTLKDKDANGNYIAYANLQDIFANKDARLYGTVIYPGSTFRSQQVDIQAGVAIWNGTSYEFRTGELGSTYSDGGKLTGHDGPRNGETYVSNSGFYLRKFVCEDPVAAVQPTLAENWWPWFRLGEIYLNAAEAAFELGEPSAKDYINTLREKHGGFPANSISVLTNDIIRNERRIELAFEDHRFFDLKRWRIAHEVWDADPNDSNAVIHGLYPYRVIRPGHADNGKYIFERVRPTRFLYPRYFRMANYYSSIADNVLNNNPKLVKNPFH